MVGKNIQFDVEPCADLITEIEGFSEFGRETLCETVNGTRYFTNEFWTSRQRQASPLHEISYRACFKPQLPAFFIKRLTRPGDVVYDPFMGRGTTPVEAALRGRIPYGNDVNPLSLALAAPRLNPPHMEKIIKRLNEIPWREFRGFARDDLLVFYHPETLGLLEGLRSWLLERRDSNRLDRTDKWIRMVALNRLTGHSSGFFSVFSMPPNQAVSIASQKKINARRRQSPPYRDIPKLIAKKSGSLLAGSMPRIGASLLLSERSHATHQIPSQSVDLTVTSPPFLNVVNYKTDNWLRCWFLGVDPDSVGISCHHSVSSWRKFISATLGELHRVTRRAGYVAFEVGEVRKGKIRLEEEVIRAARAHPFELLGVMVNAQTFTKTSNCWGVNNNRAGTNSNRIVLLRRL